VQGAELSVENGIAGRIIFYYCNFRYLIISSESVMYAKGLDRENCVIREVLTFDYNFTVKHGLKDTGHEREIILKSSSRRL
jgi:hypothetical protein